MGNKSYVKQKIENVLYKANISGFPLNFIYHTENYKLKSYFNNAFKNKKYISLPIIRKYTPYDDLQLRESITHKKNIYLGILFSENEIFEKMLLANTQLITDYNSVRIHLEIVDEISSNYISDVLTGFLITSNCFSKQHCLLDLYRHMQPWQNTRLQQVETYFKEKYKDICKQKNELEPMAYNCFYKVFYVEDENYPPKSITILNSRLLFRHSMLTNSLNTKFSSAEEYYIKWTNGLYREYLLHPEKYSTLLRMFQNTTIRKYFKLLLAKNYYEQASARERYKIPENLQTLFLQDNRHLIALIANPKKHPFHDIYENDNNTLPKVTYNYYTISHLLKTGIFKIPDLEHWEHITINDYHTFYHKAKELSNSLYEKRFIDCYLQFLFEQTNPEDIPLLIPEFRYDGINEKHSYRLDFLILNFYTNQLIGIEISPSSTHCNSNNKKQWIRENDKRNDFFSKYGISLITFTDDELKNIPDCFNKIKPYLATELILHDTENAEQKLLSIQ